RVAGGGEGTTIRRWDLATFRETTRMEGTDKIASTLAVSPDGKTLASVGGGHEPGTLSLWDLETGKQRQSLSRIEPMWSATFSPDGKSLAGGTARDMVKVWNLETGAVRELKAPDCRSVTFSRDGKLLASTCGNAPSTTRPGAGGLRLWDTATWKEQMP